MNLDYVIQKYSLRRRAVDNSSIQSAYSRYSGVYDVVFGAVFKPGRHAAINALNSQPQDRILDVGVGTGLSLPMYRDDVKVVGIDISVEMLEKARSRIAQNAITQVESILEMDAQDMAFADNSFDSVVAMYAVSVVPDLNRMFDEVHRVCKPGGEFVLVNHFRSGNYFVKLFENALTPFSAVFGFHPNLDCLEIVQLTGMELLESRTVNAFGYWRLMRFRNHG